MNTTNETGFDGAPRFRTEVMTCTAFRSTAGRCCGAKFSVTWDRHGLGYDRVQTCPTCSALPSTRFRIDGMCPRSGRSVRILDGHLLSMGERTSYTTDHATVRRWIADAVANGVTDIRITFTRHTNALGTRERRVRL